MDTPNFANAPNMGPSFDKAAEKLVIDPNRDFNAVTGGPEDDKKAQEEPHLRYRPPELVPGGIDHQAPDALDDIIREELTVEARRSIQEAHHRFELGVDERDEYVPTEADVAELARWSHENDNEEWLRQEPEDDTAFEQRLLQRRAERDLDHGHER